MLLRALSGCGARAAHRACPALPPRLRPAAGPGPQPHPGGQRRTATRLLLRLATGDARGAGIDAGARAELRFGGKGGKGGGDGEGMVALRLAPLQGCFTRDSEELFEAVVAEDIVPYDNGSALRLAVAPDRRAGNGWLLHKAALAVVPVGDGASDGGSDYPAVEVASRDSDGAYVVAASSDERLAQTMAESPAAGEVRLAALCGAWVGSEEGRSMESPGAGTVKAIPRVKRGSGPSECYKHNTPSRQGDWVT